MEFRRASRLRVPITLSVVLMALNVTLMVCWIVLLAGRSAWSALTVGTIIFALILIGLIVYLVLTIKVIRLNRRQANFVDSVTHELKTPIASLKLYLETLQLRSLDEARRREFYRTMQVELARLDHLISQLLEVGRLDAIGQHHEPEDVALEPLLHSCAEAACARNGVVGLKGIHFDIQPAVVRARRIILEMIFGNLLDNAIKYGGDPPEVDVEVRLKRPDRVVVRVADNGVGVPHEIRRKIFRLFFRGGDELERRRTGTGLGLYIVHTLLRQLKGRIIVYDRGNGPGSVFEVELPAVAPART